MSLSREPKPSPLTPVGGSSPMLSPEERARREEDRLFETTVETRNRERCALILEQIKAETRQITRSRELVALHDELAEAQTQREKERLLHEIGRTRTLGHCCQRCHVPFNTLTQDGGVQVNATKGRTVCYRTVDKMIVGSAECVRAQDVERKKKPDEVEAPTPAQGSRNGHRAHAC